MNLLINLEIKKQVEYILAIMSRQIQEAHSLQHLYELLMNLSETFGGYYPTILEIYYRCFEDYGRGFKKKGGSMNEYYQKRITEAPVNAMIVGGCIALFIVIVAIAAFFN